MTKCILSLSFLVQLVIGMGVARAADLKEWTVIVYLNGHNSLDSYGKQNIDSMSTVGSTDQMDVVVQWASEANGNTKRLHVTKGGYDLVQEMAPVDMGDYSSFVTFVEWAMKNYPAKKYFVDIWDHGNGWHKTRPLLMGMKPLDLSYDDRTGHFITTEQLGQSLKQIVTDTGSKIELYGSDACLMAMVEVAAEVSDSAKFFAGSEESEPGAGWPYATFLADMAQNPTWDGGQVAKDLSMQYKAAYNGGVYGNGDVTFAAWDMSQLKAMYQPIQALAKELSLLNGADLTNVLNAANGSQAFALQDYRDLGDFLNQLNKAPLRLTIHALGDVQAAMKNLVMENDVTSVYAKATGVSIWLPTQSGDWTTYKDRYQAMQFNKATGWYDFLTKLQTAANVPPNGN